jgi:sugar-specific transcriptional regulator TrmB
MIVTTKVVVMLRRIFLVTDNNGFSNDKVIDCFQEMGLSKNESKIYLAIIRNNLSYGSKIQKVSGVPSPKVYETIKSLMDKGLIFPSGEKPVCYQALPLEDFIKNNTNKYKNISNYLLANKDSINRNTYPNWLWQLQGYDNIMDKASEFIDKAKNNIMISFWHEDGVNVQQQLESAVERGVEIISNQMSETLIQLGKVFRHPPLGVVEEMHSSEFILVADDICGLFVFKNQDEKIEGYYTFNQGVIKILNNYILHDIYINRMVSDFKKQVFETYGDNLEKLINL